MAAIPAAAATASTDLTWYVQQQQQIGWLQQLQLQQQVAAAQLQTSAAAYLQLQQQSAQLSAGLVYPDLLTVRLQPTASQQQAASTSDAYAASLQRGRSIMAKNWQTATNKQRDIAWQELEVWAQYQIGKYAKQCTPNDLVVYLESCFLHRHGRQAAEDGSTCPAPSTLNTTIAHLSTRFQELGCRGMWDWGTCSGNPCSSMEVRTFKGGYANQMQDLGFKPTAAKPISEGKLQQLVQLLKEEAGAYEQVCNQEGHEQQPWHVEALLWRDACIVQYLWDSKRRPAEASKLQTSQVDVSIDAGNGSSVVARPNTGKMCHASRGSRQPRPVDVPSQQLAELLLQYVHCLYRAGKVIGRFMFSPLQANRQDLQGNQGLSTAAMGARVVWHLKRLGLYEGESLYSIKRGAMQHDYFVHGLSLQAIGEAADINTAAIVQMYVDPSRHM